METVFDVKEHCCGCTACINICPQKAITFESDDLGYLYPKIKQSLCIDCGLCKKVCCFTKENINNSVKYLCCFALKHKEVSVIKKSRSAGAFTAISDYILQNKGIVYGVSFTNDMKICHCRADNQLTRNNFRESKYVQSDLGTIFKNVENDLRKGFLVMFTGTGCQCEGLKSYLNLKKINTDKLLLTDIICHGVPSAKIFNDYLKWNEKKYHSKILDFKFRDKDKYSWADGIEKITFNNKKIIYQDYFTGFIFDYFVRPSCYNCKYTTPYRNSDITLGDFWGSEKVVPDFTDYKNGCSLVLIHSIKGKEVFDKITDNIFFKEINIKDCLQPRLIVPRKKEEIVDFYSKIYIEKGFYFLMKNYATNSLSLKKRINRKLLNYLKKIQILFNNK